MPDPNGGATTGLIWLSGPEPEVEPLSSGTISLRKLRLTSDTQARAVALRVARTHTGLVIVEGSCPMFTAVCRIVSRSPSIELVTLHPALRRTASLTLPAPLLHLAE